MKEDYSGFGTDERLLEAIEAVSGGCLGCSGGCDEQLCDDAHSDYCCDPAVVLWRDGGEDEALRAWLDSHYPEWREDAPLPWGAGEFE